MVTATSNFAISTRRLENKRDEIEEREDRNNEQSEPGWSEESPLLVKERQAFRVNIVNVWLNNRDVILGLEQPLWHP